MENNFEIILNFKKNTGSPDRTFLVMADYLNSFDNLIHIIGKGIDPEGEVSCELSSIKIGSLKSIVTCIGDYCSVLSRVPSMVARQMVDFDEIREEKQIEDFVNNIEDDISTNMEPRFPNQTNINRLEFSEGLKKLTEASQRLVPGETIDVRNENNIVNLNTKTKFSRDPKDIFKEYSEKKREVETLLIRTPVFVGNSMWGFKSIQRKKAFSAPINDKEWLEKYQNRQIQLEPGDAISATVEYVMYKEKGAKFYEFKDHKVIKVKRPVRNKELQNTIDLEPRNEIN